MHDNNNPVWYTNGSRIVDTHVLPKFEEKLVEVTVKEEFGANYDDGSNDTFVTYQFLLFLLLEF